jgi:predicted transcriptional regulator
MTSNWAELLQDALKSNDEVVPEGWKTREEISKEIGKSLSHTAQLLLAATKSGAIERRKYRASGQSVFHYREIER